MKQRILSRRELIKFGSLAVASGLMLSGCVPSSSNRSLNSTGTALDDSGSSTGTTTADSTCSVINSETAGPYPAHDDSAINVLTLAGIERADIRSSLNTGSYTGTATATGVPLTVTINLKDVLSNCAPLEGYAVYLWHCDKDGKYSMYTSGVTNETYLRGVQETDANGSVTFQTIFPGCYDGRMPHMHFEVYQSVAQAIDESYVLKTSQLTFPLTTMSEVYDNVSSYASSKTNYGKITFATDNVFSDGVSKQMTTVTGNYLSGYAATLNVGINA